MEIHIKIKDVLGQDERGRHIIYVDENDLLESLMERKGWLFQEVFKERLLKTDKRILCEFVENKDLRNTIYMQEKAKREKRPRLDDGTCRSASRKRY